MEEDSLIAQIASDFYIVLAVAIVLFLMVGWLTSLDIQVSEAQKNQYRQAAILENILELDASTEEFEESGIEPYNYSEERAMIPIEYFNNELEEGGEGIGYYTEGVLGDTDANCYLPEVSGLEPGKFSYRLDFMKGQSEGSQDWGAYDLPAECEEQQPKTQGELEGSVFSQALLVRKNLDMQPLPVRIYVYQAE